MPSSMPLRKAVARSEKQSHGSVIQRTRAKKERLPKWVPWVIGTIVITSVFLPLIRTILFSPKMKD